MTGYGSDAFHLNGTMVTIEIKSINSRYLDFIPKIPRSLQDIELSLKKLIQTYFYRGRIELYISITGDSLESKNVYVDWNLLDQYINQLREVQERYQLTEGIPLSVIASREELFTIQEHQKPDDSLHSFVYESVKKACEEVISSRKSEGKFLINDILSRIDRIKTSLTYIEQQQDQIYYHYRKRIKERIEEHVEKQIDIDEIHLLQEVAILAEKGDIQEELTRLSSHLQHFKQIVTQDNEIGRKLDFITQEMHRETNTIGAKSIDSKISEEIVMIKSEIEKVKEQLQNIE